MTEKLAVISLFNNFSAPAGVSRNYVGLVKEAHIQEIVSNIAVVGHDKWTAEDHVKRVSFGIRHSMSLFRNHEKVERLSIDRDRIEDGKDDWLLLRFTFNGAVVRLYCTAQYDQWAKDPKEIEPRFELEFDEAVQFGKHMYPNKQISTFCSMAFCVLLTPFDIKISRQALDEYLDCVENNRPTSEHKVLYHQSEFKIDPNYLNIFGSPVQAQDNDCLVNLGECLRVWMERGSKWNDAYALMMGAFVRRNEFGAERLLNAYKWLEELPNAKEIKIIDDEIIDVISKAAIDAAKGAKIDNVKDRIPNSLKSIGHETSSQRFRRLIGYAWNPLLLPYQLDDMVKHLDGGRRLRLIVICVLAAQTMQRKLCYLLMLSRHFACF